MRPERATHSSTVSAHCAAARPDLGDCASLLCDCDATVGGAVAYTTAGGGRLSNTCGLLLEMKRSCVCPPFIDSIVSAEFLLWLRAG